MNLLILATTPILLLIILMLLLRKPLYIAAPITFIYTAIISITHWAIKKEYLIASTTKGLLVSIDIILIILGAIFFLEYLKNTGLLKKIQQQITIISTDKRVQAIIIIWFFGSFIEGTAGFGTPAAITAPLLVAIGFPAILSVIIALIGNSTAVVFGAIGTPINIGYTGLDTTLVPETAALINLIAGIIVPIMIIAIINIYEKQPIKKFFELLPYAIWAALCFLIPYYFLSYIGPEFPSLLGAIIGLIVIIYTTKRKFLLPKTKEKQEKQLKEIKEKSNYKEIIKDFTPYIILTILLLIGKYFLPSQTITLQEGITHNLTLYNPGIIFIITIILSKIILKHDIQKVKDALKKTTKILIYPFIAILFITATVQLLIQTSHNSLEIPGMLNTIAESLINKNFILISPLIGAFGAFLSGSATVSNILFGNLQVQASQITGISLFLLLALQVVGAGIGNMISLTNIVAAQATVKLKNKEIQILKGTIIPAIIYLVLATITGLIIATLI